MGILVFWGSIVIFIPLIIISIYLFIKTRKNAIIEYQQLKLRLNQPSRTIIALFATYTICLMLAHYEYWQRLLSWLTGHLITSNNWSFLNNAVLGWDSWFDIFDYWIALIITYSVISFFLFIICNKYNIRLFKNNNYIASIFNLGLYPFMVISFLGWIYKW